jgi:hypothetical protein
MKIRLLGEMSKNNTNNSVGLIFALKANPPKSPLDTPMVPTLNMDDI